MSETEQLISRIHALAKRMNRSPSTLSTKLFGGGMVLSEIEAGGRSITMTTYTRVQAMLTEMEASLQQSPDTTEIA